MINLNYKDSRNLNEQIHDQIKELIISGALKKNEKLPSVRELSVSLAVNPNTVQKAYKTLEAEGFIYSISGRGNYVSEVTREARNVDELFDGLTALVKELSYLKVEKSFIINLVNNIYEEGRE